MRITTSIIAPLIGFAIYTLAVMVMRKRLLQTPLWLPPLLWITAGAVTSTSAALLRSATTDQYTIDGLNIALNGVFTLVTLGIATTGFASLTERRRQTQVLKRQRAQLLDLRSQAQAFAVEQSTNLLAVIAQVVGPEIQRLRTRVVDLGIDPSIDRLQSLQNEIARESTQMVRTISHEMVPQTERIDVAPTPILSTWPDSLRLIAGARISVPLTLLAALLLFIAQFNLGCVGVPSLAVLGFLVVTLGIGSLGYLDVLARPPVSLIWLIAATVAGFAGYHFVLSLGPDRCTWTSTGWEFAIATATAFTMFLGLTIVVQASRQAAQMVHDLEVTNDQITEVTRQFNRAGSLTQDQISRVLHGPIQGRLAAAAMALRVHLDRMQAGEAASVSDLSERITALLDDAAADLEHLSDPYEASSTTPSVALRDLINRWGGFLQTNVDIESDAAEFLDDHPDWAARIIQCTEEALTNASRHGSARHATVHLSLEASSFLALRVFDDGHGPDSHFEMGLGLNCITMSGGTWSLAPREGGGALLLARWPLP